MVVKDKEWPSRNKKPRLSKYGSQMLDSNTLNSTDNVGLSGGLEACNKALNGNSMKGLSTSQDHFQSTIGTQWLRLFETINNMNHLKELHCR